MPGENKDDLAGTDGSALPDPYIASTLPTAREISAQEVKPAVASHALATLQRHGEGLHSSESDTAILVSDSDSSGGGGASSLTSHDCGGGIDDTDPSDYGDAGLLSGERSSVAPTLPDKNGTQADGLPDGRAPDMLEYAGTHFAAGATIADDGTERGNFGYPPNLKFGVSKLDVVTPRPLPPSVEKLLSEYAAAYDRLVAEGRCNIRMFAPPLVLEDLHFSTASVDATPSETMMAPHCRTQEPRRHSVSAASLRTGLGGIICLWEKDANITYVVCVETFEHPDLAEEVANAFDAGAARWRGAGGTFVRVGRWEPATFRIVFTPLPDDGPTNVIAEGFFPCAATPEKRTLYVFGLAFHPRFRPHMAGYMSHEVGHIVGVRHGFDEHISKDGSEDPYHCSVKYGIDNPDSVMMYHNDPAKYVVQESDIQQLKGLYDHKEAMYDKLPITRVTPRKVVYSPMG